MTESALREELERLTKTEKLMSLGELATRANLARSHLSNFINDKRGISPERRTALETAMTDLALEREDLETLRSRYQEILTWRLRGLDLRFIFRGMPDVELSSVPVPEIFVEREYQLVLRGQIRKGSSCTTLEETAAKNAVVHLYGPAGSGKTTSIRHAALKLLEGSSPSRYLPILLPLSVLNRALNGRSKSESSIDEAPPAKIGSGTDLMELICRWYAEIGKSKNGRSPNFRPLFGAALRRGEAWIMLDGFDEIADNSEYEAVRHLINAFIDEHITHGRLANRLTITERGTGPFGLSPIDQASQYYLPDFDAPRRRLLIAKWADLLASQRTADMSQRAEVKDYAERLTKEIETEPFTELTGNPFYSTLMIVTSLCRTPAQLFYKPAASWVLNLFFDTISGLWNQLRSLERLPSSVSTDLSPELNQTLLSYLARQMLDVKEESGQDLRSYQAQSIISDLYVERFSLSPTTQDAHYARVQHFTADFVHFTKDAGILRWPLSNEEKVEYTHLLVRDWFAGLWLHHRLPVLNDRIADYICKPAPNKQQRRDSLTFALGALESVWKNLDALHDAVRTALDLSPLNDPRLKHVIPLGLDLCVNLLEQGRAFSGVEQFILRDLRSMFETTNYAVLTNNLYPRVQRLLERGDWAARLPRTKDRLEAWLKKLSREPEVNWTKEIDTIWRYQNRFGCIDLLFAAVEQRHRQGGLDQWTYEYLVRRFVFALRFVAFDDDRAVVGRLEQLLSTFHKESVIWSMASYSLTDVRDYLSRTGDAPHLLLRVDEVLSDIAVVSAELSTVEAKSVPDLIRRLAGYPIPYLAKHAKSIMEPVLSSSGKSIKEIVDELVNGMSDEYDSRDRAIAIILLVLLFSTREYGLSTCDLFPGGQCSHVMDALAAVSSSDDQHSNVDACQVYDFGAWAIRSMLQGRGTLSGLEDLPVPAVR